MLHHHPKKAIPASSINSKLPQKNRQTLHTPPHRPILCIFFAARPPPTAGIRTLHTSTLCRAPPASLNDGHSPLLTCRLLSPLRTSTTTRYPITPSCTSPPTHPPTTQPPSRPRLQRTRAERNRRYYRPTPRVRRAANVDGASSEAQQRHCRRRRGVGSSGIRRTPAACVGGGHGGGGGVDQCHHHGGVGGAISHSTVHGARTRFRAGPAVQTAASVGGGSSGGGGGRGGSGGDGARVMTLPKPGRGRDRGGKRQRPEGSPVCGREVETGARHNERQQALLTALYPASPPICLQHPPCVSSDALRQGKRSLGTRPAALSSSWEPPVPVPRPPSRHGCVGGRGLPLAEKVERKCMARCISRALTEEQVQH